MLSLQTEGKTLPQQRADDLLDCDTGFIAVVWNPTSSISEVMSVLNYDHSEEKGDEGGLKDCESRYLSFRS